MNDTECASVFARALPFWDKLTQAQQAALCRGTTAVRYEKGRNVHGARGECTGAILVRSGLLRAYMLSEDGREITLYRLNPNDVCMLSASCVLQSITFDVFVDAEIESDCLVINPAVLARLTQESLYVENFGLRVATERFSEVMWTMQQILFMSFDKRLAVFLLDELSKNGGNTVSMTQEQIARYVGSAREVVSRMLKYFASENIVAVSRGGVTILDRKRLQALVR